MSLPGSSLRVLIRGEEPRLGEAAAGCRASGVSPASLPSHCQRVRRCSENGMGPGTDVRVNVTKQGQHETKTLFILCFNSHKRDSLYKATAARDSSKDLLLTGSSGAVPHKTMSATGFQVVRDSYYRPHGSRKMKQRFIDLGQATWPLQASVSFCV